jgi:2-phospho-L-lactate transferase/gluconeogenesis factor (CofD/UPF0052 family)
VENSAVNPDLMVNQNMDLRGVGCGYFDGELRAVADALAGEEPTAHARLAAYAAADKTGMTENYESAASVLRAPSRQSVRKLTATAAAMFW